MALIDTTDQENENPLMLFLSMLNASESKRQYPRRLKTFFDYLGLESENNKDLELQCKAFVSQFKNDDDKTRSLQKWLIRFAAYQKERVAKKEISPSTVPNYFKAIKLFTQANNLDNKVNWKLVSKSYPKGLQAADDRAPTLEEIQKLIRFTDRRIEPLVLILVSSGIRIGAFETLFWKHISPKFNENDELIAAKMIVYPNDSEKYYTFLTPEAYRSVKEWMDYRSASGEDITGESIVMRDIWQIGDIEGVRNPRPLNTFALTRLLNRAWQAQKIRHKLPQNGKRHEFKTAHGFRKYFKTQTEQARVSSAMIEMMMGHSLGVSSSYMKPTEDVMLQEYVNAIDYLTVNQSVVLINKSLRKQEETIRNSFVEMESKHRKEIVELKEKYEMDLKELQQRMEYRFQELVDKIDVSKLTK